jgi:hypothetical protein
MISANGDGVVEKIHNALARTSLCSKTFAPYRRLYPSRLLSFLVPPFCPGDAPAFMYRCARTCASAEFIRTTRAARHSLYDFPWDSLPTNSPRFFDSHGTAVYYTTLTSRDEELRLHEIRDISFARGK